MRNRRNRGAMRARVPCVTLTLVMAPMCHPPAAPGGHRTSPGRPYGPQDAPHSQVPPPRPRRQSTGSMMSSAEPAASTKAAARSGRRLGLGGSPSARACSSAFRLSVPFHRFLIALSVRPGSSFEISVQRLPSALCLRQRGTGAHAGRAPRTHTPERPLGAVVGAAGGRGVSGAAGGPSRNCDTPAGSSRPPCPSTPGEGGAWDTLAFGGAR